MKWGPFFFLLTAEPSSELTCNGDGQWPIGETADGEPYGDNRRDESKYLAWMKTLPLYHVERNANTIFCHAGIDEEAGDFWELGTEDYVFTSKYPAQTDCFYMKIVAGHIGTAEISGDPNFHDIYFDGESHYYIDGTVLRSGVIPVIKVDTENNKYYEVKESGAWPILPYQEIK